MLVSQQNFGHLLRLITQCGKGLHIAGDILACIDCSRFIRHFFRCSRRKAGIHQNDFVSGINQIVGEAGAILDGVIKFFGSFFSAENKRLCGKPSFLKLIALISITFPPYSSAFTQASTSAMSAVGSKRAATLPSRSMMNLVKFYLMSGFLSQSGSALAHISSSSALYGCSPNPPKPFYAFR